MVHMEAGKRDALYGTSSGQDDFSNKLQTLSFKMSEYVNVTTSGKDTIPVADYAFPRTFGLARSTNLLFVFNKEEMKDKEWISFPKVEIPKNLILKTCYYNSIKSLTSEK